MVVAVGLIVGPRAAVVVEDVVRKFGIIVDVVGNRARALFGMPRHKLQRPLQRNERCGLGRDFRRHRGQPARAQQGFDVARERRLDARALRRGDLIAWQRYGTPAYRALECGFDRRRQCAERNGRRQQRQAHEFSWPRVSRPNLSQPHRSAPRTGFAPGRLACAQSMQRRAESYSAIETPVCLIVAPLRQREDLSGFLSSARRWHRSLSNACAIGFCPCIQRLAHTSGRWTAVRPVILAGDRGESVIRSRIGVQGALNRCVLFDSPAHAVAPATRSRRKGAARRRRRIRVRA